ncbi:hypothetical protein [Latilactobacillus sakei]|uniref:hypothetical protein n=1 Tax=Latilactobacillus sakei TaxID=1599 RepID=UPI000A8F6AD1
MYGIDPEGVGKIQELISGPNDLSVDLFGEEYATFAKLVAAFKLRFENTKTKDLIIQVKKFRSDSDWASKTAERQVCLNQKYEEFSANSKVFMSPLWTLEYSLLRSSLRHLTVRAIAETRFVRENDREKFIKQFEEDYKTSPNEAAYNAYAALNKGSVSKTQVSEELAKLIMGLSQDEKEELKNKIVGDTTHSQNEKCKYLINAIKFASGQEVEQD